MSEKLTQKIFEKLDSLVGGEDEFCASGIHVLKFEDDWTGFKINFRVYTGNGHCVEIICESMDDDIDEIETNDYSFYSDFYDGFKEISEERFYDLIKDIQSESSSVFTLR